MRRGLRSNDGGRKDEEPDEDGEDGAGKRGLSRMRNIGHGEFLQAAREGKVGSQAEAREW